MAKKSKQNMTNLIINILIIALAVLTVVTLFMPFLKSSLFTSGMVDASASVSATGSDIFTAAFNGEVSRDFSDGANRLIGMKTAEENSFVAIVMIWSYIATVFVALATLVFGVLNILGMKFRLVNTILGTALIVLALVTFIFTLITAAKNTEISEVLGQEIGTRTSAMVSAYMMFAGILAGGLQVYRAKQK